MTTYFSMTTTNSNFRGIARWHSFSIKHVHSLYTQPKTDVAMAGIQLTTDRSRGTEGERECACLKISDICLKKEAAYSIAWGCFSQSWLLQKVGDFSLSEKHYKDMWNEKLTVLFCSSLSYLGPCTGNKLQMLHFQRGLEMRDTAPQFCPKQSPHRKVYHYWE